MPTSVFKEKLEEEKKAYEQILSLAQLIQKHVKTNVKDFTQELRKLDNYDDGITSRDLKTAFENVDFDITDQEADDIIIYFRCRKDQNNRFNYKELLKKIQKEDFSSIISQKSNISNKQFVKILTKIKETLEENDVDLRA